MGRRLRVWAALGIVAAVGALAHAQGQRGGAPGVARSGAGAGPSAPPPRDSRGGDRARIFAFAAEDGRCAWLYGDERLATLFVAESPALAGRAVARGEGWRELALFDGDAWVLAWEAGADRLIRLRLPEGRVVASAPATEAPHARAGALRALDTGSGRRLGWIETRPAADPALLFLPPAGPAARLRWIDSSGGRGASRSWPSAEPAGPGDLLGVSGEAAIVRVRRALTTEWFRVPLEGGSPRRLAAEPERQQGLLVRRPSGAPGGDQLYWTAPSEEAATALPFAAVRRLDLRAPEATPETLTDWLAPGGDLLPLPEGIVYLGDGLWRLPERFGAARRLRESPGGAPGLPVADGDRILLLGRAPQPLPFWPEEPRAKGAR